MILSNDPNHFFALWCCTENAGSPTWKKELYPVVRITAPFVNDIMFEDRLEFDVGVELYGERTDIASGHHISRIGGCFILVYEFRTGDAALRTGLV